MYSSFFRAAFLTVWVRAPVAAWRAEPGEEPGLVSAQCFRAVAAEAQTAAAGAASDAVGRFAQVLAGGARASDAPGPTLSVSALVAVPAGLVLLGASHCGFSDSDWVHSRQVHCCVFAGRLVVQELFAGARSLDDQEPLAFELAYVAGPPGRAPLGLSHSGLSGSGFSDSDWADSLRVRYRVPAAELKLDVVLSYRVVARAPHCVAARPLARGRCDRLRAAD